MSTPKAASQPGTAAHPAKGTERPLPKDRASLLALHQELRHRRDALPLLSEERAATIIEIARVEVQVARIERAMDPPLG
jgi:vacuolar-type H+-ATPase subunit D/Vma8